MKIYSRTREWFRDLQHGIWNVIRWAPIIWHDVDWDYSALAHVMEYKLNRMAPVLENGLHANGDRYAKQCRVCAELLRRIVADNYFENAGYDSGAWSSMPEQRKGWIVKHSQKMRERDVRYLGFVLGKYLTHWWD